MATGSELSVNELIQLISQELLDSRAERLKRGDPAIFQVDELTLEISFVITSAAGGKAGVDLKVIKAEAEGKYSKESTHKLTLKMKALGSDDASTDDPLADLGRMPFRPRGKGLI